LLWYDIPFTTILLKICFQFEVPWHFFGVLFHLYYFISSFNLGAQPQRPGASGSIHGSGGHGASGCYGAGCQTGGSQTSPTAQPQRPGGSGSIHGSGNHGASGCYGAGCQTGGSSTSQSQKPEASGSIQIS
jgi:hypothetical protein